MKLPYLVNSKASLVASIIYFFALDIKSPTDGPIPFGAYSNHTDVFGEIKAMRLQMSKENYRWHVTEPKCV
jgi:hypothetical protein